jgi:RHS repeat-associated protein
MNVRYQYKYNNLTTIENGGIHNLKYLSSKPNALTDHKFENNNQVINYTATNSVSDSHEYTYTTFDKLASINQADGNVMLEMEYGVDQQRIHMQVADHGNMIIDNYYIGTANMEVNKGEGFSYLYAEGKPFAIHKQSTDEIFYLHLDNQGSLMAISNNDGDIVETRSYDAWGRPRNPYAIWIYDQTSTFGGAGFGITTRGYTMHEHLEMFNLINMNGRLYDPVLGRMLSPDNYIQSPDNTQSYNRYSYCVNNPLKYTDPSGNFFWIPVIAAAVIFGGTNLAIQANNGNVKDFGDGFRAFGTGAVVGAAIATGVGLGLSVPYLGAAIKTVGLIYGGSTVLSGLSGVYKGATTGDWSRLENTGKIFLGNFYLDENRSFGEQLLQGVSRFT